jgi:hypothetical protein
MISPRQLVLSAITQDTAAQQIIAGGEQRQQLLATLTAAIKEHSQAAGQEAAVDAATVAAQQARRAGILTAMNLNPDFTDNLMLSTARAIDTTDAQLRAMKPEIDERMAVGMFDNPFQWLVNQTILPGLVAKYNGVVGTQNAAINLYKSKQEIAAAQENISDKMDADLALQKGVAIQKKIAAGATADLSKAQLEALPQTERSAMNLVALATHKAETLGSALRLTKDTETETNATSERETAKRTKEEQDKAMLEDVNKVQRTIGGNTYSSLKQFLSEPKPKQEQILNAARTGKYGDNFGQSFQLIADHGSWSKVAQTGAALQGWTNKTIQEAERLKAVEIANMKNNPREYEKFISDPVADNKLLQSKLNLLQHKYVDETNTDMRHASDGNPYKIQYTQIAKDESLASNPLAIYLKQYGPGGTEPRISKVDEGYLLDRFGFAIANGKMPMPDAVKAVTDFYKTAVDKTLSLTTPNIFGMPAPSKTYAVNLADIAGLSKPVDLGNPTEVEAALTRIVARRNGGMSGYIGAAFLGNKERMYTQPAAAAPASPLNAETAGGI